MIKWFSFSILCQGTELLYCPFRVQHGLVVYYYYYFLLRVLCPFQSTAVVLLNTTAFSRLVSRDPYAVVMCSEREPHHSPSHGPIFRRRGATIPSLRSDFMGRRMLLWNVVALWLGHSWIVIDTEPTSVQVNEVRRAGSVIQGMELTVSAPGRYLDPSHSMWEVRCGYYLTWAYQTRCCMRTELNEIDVGLKIMTINRKV